MNHKLTNPEKDIILFIWIYFGESLEQEKFKSLRNTKNVFVVKNKVETSTQNYTMTNNKYILLKHMKAQICKILKHDISI